MKLRTTILLVLLGLGLAIWISWPLAKYFTWGIPFTSSAEPGGREARLAPGDHLQYLYHLHLLRETVDGEIPPFSNPYEFAGPYQRETPYIYFPFAFLYVPFSYISPATGYNVLIVLSFLGTMVAGYGLARAWGASVGGAVCAGIVLSLFPNRLQSLFGGHAAGSTFFLFPMAWWGLEKNWQTGRKSWGLMAGMSLMVMSVQDMHYLFFFCLLLPLWAIWKLLEEKVVEFPARTRDERFRLGSVMRWQVVTAIVLLTASYYFHQVRMRAVSPISPTLVGLLVFFSLIVVGVVSLANVVLRWLGVEHGSFRKSWLSWPWAGFWVLLGYFAANYVNKPAFGSKIVLFSLLLFGAGNLAFLARAIQKKKFSLGRIRFPWKRVLPLWVAAGGLAVALLYSVYLKFAVFAGSEVAGGRTTFEVGLFSIPFRDLFTRSPQGGGYVGWVMTVLVVASVLLAVWRSKGGSFEPQDRPYLKISWAITALGMILACGILLGNVFPLYAVLLRLVPFLNYIRATAKFHILTATGGAVAVSLFLTLSEERLRRHPLRHWLAPVAGVLLILDWGPITSVGVSVLPEKHAVYDVVAEEGKKTRLLEVPIWPGDSAYSAPYQYGTMLTGVPTINGYSPAIPTGYRENISDPLYPLNFGILREEEFHLLRSLNVRLITFHQELFPRQVSPLPATHSLKRLRLNPNLEFVVEEGGAYLFRMAGQDFRSMRGTPGEEGSSVSYYFSYDVLKHQVGVETADPDATTGKAWRSGRQNGYLFFGPFLVPPPGEYVAVFRLKVEGPSDLTDVGYLDVYTGDGKEIERRKTLDPAEWPKPQGYKLIEIPFRVTPPQRVQTRCEITEARKGAVSLDFVLIKPAGLGEAIRLEAEDFFSSVGRLIRNKEATQGVCLAIDGRPQAGQPLLEERFVFLRAGRYEFGCSAQGKEGKSGELHVRRLGIDSTVNRFDVRGAGEANGFVLSTGLLNAATDGVYGLSLFQAGKGLRAVDFISVRPAPGI